MEASSLALFLVLGVVVLIVVVIIWIANDPKKDK